MTTLMHHRSALGSFLNGLGLTGAGCEVGVFEAEYAAQILTTWHGRLLYLVDPWCHLSDYLDSWNGSDQEMEKRYRRAIERLAPFEGRYRILRVNSDQATALVPDASLDFVYIDANHAYQHVRHDLQSWYPKVRSGGIMAGHDYYDALADESLEPQRGTTGAKEMLTSYGVKSAVNEFVADRGLVIRVTDEAYPTWYLQK